MIVVGRGFIFLIQLIFVEKQPLTFDGFYDKNL